MQNDKKQRARIAHIRCGLRPAIPYQDEHKNQKALEVNEVEWVSSSLSQSLRERLEFVPVRAAKEEPFPDLSDISGIIIGGSSYMLSTGLEPWIERIQDYIRQAAARHVPILGICFGHQLIAQTFGSRVERCSPREFGTVRITLSEEGRQDKLFHGLDTQFDVFMAHQEIVTHLSEDIRVLAFNDHSPYQAIGIGDSIRGVQFHPEFSQEIMEALWHVAHIDMAAESLDIEHIRASLTRPPLAKTVLENFMRYFVLA